MGNVEEEDGGEGNKEDSVEEMQENVKEVKKKKLTGKDERSDEKEKIEKKTSVDRKGSEEKKETSEVARRR